MIVERLNASKPTDQTPAPQTSPASIPPTALDHASRAAGVQPATPAPPTPARASRWQATHALACLRAETERVKVLVDFLARPICAHGGNEPDPDIVTAYNLAVEAALHGIRRAAQSSAG